MVPFGNFDLERSRQMVLSLPDNALSEPKEVILRQIDQMQAARRLAAAQNSDSEDNDTHDDDSMSLSVSSEGSRPNTSDAKAKSKADPLDPKLVGMSVGFKNLYSGKEDKHGRFQWQDKIPENVLKPAEDAETQKLALILRYVKVYSDPRKTLGLHSIVVQSPLLKKLLETVLAGYPGVTVGLQRLEFTGKFEPLIHRFPELKAAIEDLKRQKHESKPGVDSDKKEEEPSTLVEQAPTTEQPAEINDFQTTESSTISSPVESTPPVSFINKEAVLHLKTDDDLVDGTTSATLDDKVGKVDDSDKSEDEVNDDNSLRLAHAQLLHDCLLGEFQALLDSSQDMKAKSVMTYDNLWTLFQPGALVFSRQDGQERAFKLKSAKYGIDRDENPVYWLSLNYIDSDGSKFGYKLMNVSISAYGGTRPISTLAAFPMSFHPHQEEIKAKLIARGESIENFGGTHYRTYDGIGWKLDAYGEKEKHSVKGRIIIDSVGWNRYNPNQAVYVSSLNKKGNSADSVDSIRSRSRRGSSIASSFSASSASYEDDCDDCGSGGMPLDGHFADEEDKKARQPLTEEQKLICTPLLRGYALKEKVWLNLFVNSVHDITFNARAFESLVLPENQKELILGFTDTQQSFRNTYDDVIEGKGRGIIILLCGPPGVGKTLTAESVAEEMRVPLFTMSAGDLGADSRHIESRLLSILGMCTRWNAICLLDEAEIFLEARSLHELERNRIVSIFLRVLEYHEGIMFLTTNLVKNFDPAFQSRIHISLDYPELSSDSRLTVWKNFLKQHDVSQANARANPPKNPTSSIKTARGGEVAGGEEVPEEEVLKQREARTQHHAITKRQMESLALLDMNGRQIKNILKTAQLLASRKAEALKHAHIVTVLEVTQHLHNSAKESDRTRNSLFA